MQSSELIKKIISIAEVTEDNDIRIITEKNNSQMHDYVWCWEQRISEEIQRRIDTGVIIPIKLLDWCVRGIGWESLDEEVPWENTK